MASNIQHLLRSPDPALVLQAEGRLQSMAASDARSELLALSSDPDPNLRAYSIIIADKLDFELLEELIAQLIKDPEGFVRWQACEIAYIRELQSVSELVARMLIQDPDAMVRNMAAIALGKLGAPRFLPTMYKALESETATDHEGTPIKEAIARSIKVIETTTVGDQ